MLQDGVKREKKKQNRTSQDDMVILVDHFKATLNKSEVYKLSELVHRASMVLGKPVAKCAAKRAANHLGIPLSGARLPALTENSQFKFVCSCGKTHILQHIKG